MAIQSPLGPIQPRWYPQPQAVWVRCSQIERGPFSEEVAVAIRLNGKTLSTFVPTAAVDFNRSEVEGQIVAEFGDNYYLVDLPPASFGAERIMVPKALIGSIVRS